jgi:hypothetical protein
LLQVGGSSIKITPFSITIQSKVIKIQADLIAQVKAGTLTQVKSDGVLICKGTLTLIN